MHVRCSFLLSFDRPSPVVSVAAVGCDSCRVELSDAIHVELGDHFPIMLREAQTKSGCVINYWCIIDICIEMIATLEEAPVCQKCMEFE